MYHRYVIIGGGISAAYAIEGIRALDREGSILLLTRENHRPYHRPTLSKDVWTESYDLERLPVHADYYYVQQQVDVRLRHEVVEVDLEARRVWDDLGQSSTYDQLLFATGVRPRRLQVEGAEHSSVRYLRDLEDYLDLERRLERVQHLTIVGSGFTAMEMAATLRAREDGTIGATAPTISIESLHGGAVAQFSDESLEVGAVLGRGTDRAVYVLDRGFVRRRSVATHRP